VAAALDATVTVGPAILNDGGVASDQIRITKGSFLSKGDKEFLARVDAENEVFLARLAQQRRDFENRIDLWR
jgi:hypothetical protein